KGTLTIKDNLIVLSSNQNGVIENRVVTSESPRTLKRIKSHVKDNYFFEFTGEEHAEELIVKSTPLILGGRTSIEGILEHDNLLGYSINGIPANYGRTMLVNNTAFNNESKKYYIGKPVKAQGHYLDNGEFIITSILENNLFIAGETELTPENQGHQKFTKDPFEYILKEMPKNSISQKAKAFRGTMHEDKGYTAKPGEQVLLLTLSGRQGDDAGTAGGHFAFGMGVVQDDEKRSIKGEYHNFYFEGEKEIIAGNTALNNYYGHLIQGQQNYRPTYTLVIYGVSKKRLKMAKEMMEIQLERARSEKGLEITQYYNCTTTGIDSLLSVGIKGINQTFLHGLFDTKKLVTKNPFFMKDGKPRGSKFDLAYAAVTDMADYIPRNALESFVKLLRSKRQRRKLGAKRIDYVFIPQTPSDRPTGGISLNDISEGLKFNKYYESDLTQKEIDEVLYDID
ncbi:MAG: hypothetical protein KAG61_01195, partial [Bacteriovoracaceae bacterium]|nr:hypothetical protein [Bacteriovoracaceae bacterium]